MPRIPLAEKPGMIQHRRSTVPMTGAPGMNFKMDEGRALANLGNAIENLGNTGIRMVSAVQQFHIQQQNTQDRLAATEARNLYRTINAELENRMAENPASFDDFRKWAEEADKKYADGAVEFTKRMSPDFRKQFEAEMKGIQAENLGRRLRIGIQAKVTADYNLFQTQWKDAALRGDPEECNRMLEEHRGRLISEQEYQQKKLDYNRLAAFGEVKRLVEAGTPGIVSRLKERDENGNYRNFTGLEETSRDRFIRVAESEDAQRRSDENQTLVDRLNNGEQVTLEQIDANFEGQTEPEAVRQKNQQRQIVRQFLNARNREKHQEAQDKARAARDRRNEEVNAHEYRLLAYEFSPDPAERKTQYAELRNEILAKYAGQGATAKRLLSQLNETFNAVAKPDSSYKNTFLYQNSMEYLKTLENEFYSYATPPEKKWYLFGAKKGEKASGDVTISNYNMMKIKLDEFIRRNPSASIQDARKFIDDAKKYINAQAVCNLISAWGNIRPDTSTNYADGEVERMVNGRVAIFSSDKKFIRWKDGK